MRIVTAVLLVAFAACIALVVTPTTSAGIATWAGIVALGLLAAMFVRLGSASRVVHVCDADGNWTVERVSLAEAREFRRLSDEAQRGYPPDRIRPL